MMRNFWTNLKQQLSLIWFSIKEFIVTKPMQAMGTIPLTAIFFLLIYSAVLVDNSPAWTGFGAYEEIENVSRAKTLWDWMGLLLVPVTLTIVAFLLNRWQAENNRLASLENQRHTILIDYIDKMTNMLSEDKLEGELDTGIRRAVKNRTLSTLRMLDEHRKAEVFRFLIESNLISSKTSHIELNSANLQKVEFKDLDADGIILKKVKFKETKFLQTDFRNVSFTDVDFEGAELEDVKFNNAKLASVSFEGAKLRNVSFKEVTLENVSFEGATLENVSFEGATFVIPKEASLSSRVNFKDAKLINTELNDKQKKASGLA